MFCGSCGTQIKEGGKFCPSCGWKVPSNNAVSFEAAVKTPDTIISEDVVAMAMTAIKETPNKPGKCRNCGKPVEEEWLACPYCKAEIARERLCAHCGKKLEPDWVICPFCKTEV
jgi:predicted amidophosphoribosyltransferase